MSNVLYQCLKDNSRTAPIQVDCARRHASQRSFWVTSRTCNPFRDAEDGHGFGQPHGPIYAPRLKIVGLGWVDYRVMRRTHSSLRKEINVDPKLVADQQGRA